MSRRPQGLTVATKPPVAIEKRIERLKPGVTFESMFAEKDLIHDGGDQCRIKKVISKRDQREYVAKIQKKSRIRGANEALFRRITERLLNIPDSEHIVKVLDCFETDDYFYTMLESLTGGDLFDFFRLLMSDDLKPDHVEREVRVVIREILCALHQMHKIGLVHKDVKLENLVFKSQGGVDVLPSKETSECAPSSPQSPKILKLVDFDFTDEWEPDSPKSKAVVGTDGYIAPEAYLGNVNPKSDIFSTGVVMYVLITGRFPFDDEIFDDQPGENYVCSPKMAEINGKLMKFNVRFGRSWDPFPQAKAFCQMMIDLDDSKRPTAMEALNHPWMRAGGTVTMDS
jgi:serine/threonine protein kinase